MSRVRTSATATYDFSGRTAIVTGAASGFGAATAKRLAVSGAAVLVTDRDEDGLAATSATLAALGASSAAVVVDLLDDEAPVAIVEAALGLGPTIDVLVNVAGIWDPAPFAEVSTESFDRHLGVNLRAPFLLTQAVAAHMPEGSSVVFLSSIGGQLVGFPGSSAYLTSKAAVRGLITALGTELASAGIRVSGVAPGTVVTPLNAEALEHPEHRQFVVDRTPQGRMGEVDEIVATVMWLCSDESSHVTATTIVVDGGYSAM